jgi:hypothetical protein
VPPGYAAQRDGPMIVLMPAAVNEKTPCVYGLSPARASKGSLEADARAAVLEALPGWQLKDESFSAMRGTAGAGWKYFWFRALAQGPVNGRLRPGYVMATAFPAAGAGRVNIVWGFGPAGEPRCELDDASFLRLFHSLRPRGWSSDGGRALASELQGLWQNSQRSGLARMNFTNNGRYDSGLATSARIGMLERTASSVSDGGYSLNGDLLTLTPDRRERGVSRYRVRVFESYLAGRWSRFMTLFDENASPPSEIRYDRIVN